MPPPKGEPSTLELKMASVLRLVTPAAGSPFEASELFKPLSAVSLVDGAKALWRPVCLIGDGHPEDNQSAKAGAKDSRKHRAGLKHSKKLPQPGHLRPNVTR